MREQSIFLIASLALSVVAVPVPSFTSIARGILPGTLAPRVTVPDPSVEQSHAARGDADAIQERRETELIRSDATVDRRQDGEFSDTGPGLTNRQDTQYGHDGNSFGRRQDTQYGHDGDSFGRRQDTQYGHDGNSFGR